MSPEFLHDCPQCLRSRDAYWQAISESGRIWELIGVTSCDTEQGRLWAAYDDAELARVAARDAFLKHQENGHDSWVHHPREGR